MEQDNRAVIRSFIEKHVAATDLRDDDDIFATGYVNSLFAVQLVMWIEQTFELPMTGADLDFANVRSIDSIARFVASKQRPAQVAQDVLAVTPSAVS